MGDDLEAGRRWDPPADDCEQRVGICCSGGGIRSAAFHLGALQVLQKDKVLEQADYLAAVSGGSYIASALAIVQRGLEDDKAKMTGRDAAAVAPAFAPRTPEEQYLRNRSSYMAPDGVGKLYVVYRALLALVCNIVLVMLPVVALTFLLTTLLYDPERNAEGSVTAIESPASGASPWACSPASPPRCAPRSPSRSRAAARSLIGGRRPGAARGWRSSTAPPRSPPRCWSRE